jgi:phosphohistidine phosphatase
MAKLFLIRHAWAGEHGDPRYPDDRLRPLTGEGRKRFAAMLKRLPDEAVTASLIATSPLVRCRQTADLLAEHLGRDATVVAREELAPGSDLEGLIAWTVQQAAENIAWVGHAPDIGRLAAALIGNSASSIRFAKGAIAWIDFDGMVEAGNGELQWLATAKLMGT